MIIYQVVGEDDEGDIWTEGTFSGKHDADSFLLELETDNESPYCWFRIREVHVK